jgi:hypothetical protein
MMSVTETTTTSYLTICDTIDQAVTVSFRPAGLSQGVVPQLYRAAREDLPLSYEIARAILDQPGAHVGILTGAAVPGFLPNGENDGPLGAVALARALLSLGYRVTILTESEIFGILDALMRVSATQIPILELDKEDAGDHAGTAMDLDILISIEKLGSNEHHVMHGATGTSRNGTRAHVDGLVNRLNEAGKLTVGIGDGGNEVGFGKIYDRARELVDHGKQCRCGCGGGIITITPTKILFPVGVSNWGGYATVAALALLTGDHSILHTPDDEVAFITAATAVDCRDGGKGIARNCVDGVPAATSAAVVQILATLVASADEKNDRPF